MDEFLGAVKSYFTPDEWNNMKRSEQKRHLKYYYVYHACIELGIDVVIPDFMDTVTKESLFNCDFCQVMFLHEYDRNQHEEFCQHRSDFIKEENLEEHSTSIDLDMFLDTKMTVEQDYFKLPAETVCFKVSGSKKTEGKFKCTDCDFECKYRKSLKNHINTHLGDKPYKCDLCDYQCARKKDLKTHEYKHTGIKPFKCSKCDFQTAYRKHLNRHMNIHLENNIYKCTECNYQCKRKDNLKSHINTHFKQKPFKCSLCGYQCSQSNQLKTHMRKHVYNV